MKQVATSIRQVAVDGLSFIVVVTLLAGGIWGLNLVEAPLYAINIFAALMVPALINTAFRVGKDINEVTHKLIA